MHANFNNMHFLIQKTVPLDFRVSACTCRCFTNLWPVKHAIYKIETLAKGNADLKLAVETVCVGPWYGVPCVPFCFIVRVSIYLLWCISLVFTEWMDPFTCVRANKEKEQYKYFLTLAWYTRLFKRGEWAWISAALILRPADNNSWHVPVCSLLCQLD